MSNKKALISGITGQDGAYLARLLLSKGYNVFGIYRRTSTPNFWRLQTLGLLDRIKLIPADVSDMASILEAITIARPDEIYNLAAQSFVGASFEKPLMSTDVNSLGTLRFLEAIRLLDPAIKFYQASSSEMFGNVRRKDLPITEQTVMAPASPYAASKLFSHHMTQVYRKSYGLFLVNGILFNHESPLRGLEFVTRKISNAVAKIALGLETKVYLGNIEARRDWGFAPEYVEAMWMMMQNDAPVDLVIASGETHSVEEFAREAFSVAGIANYRKHIVTDKKYLRPLDVNVLIGDPALARKTIGWKPKTKFRDLVRLMVEEDLSKWERYRKGEIFPWDAPNYPSETSIITRVMKL